MPRLSHPAAIRIYAAAQRFVDQALRADDSLFTPGTPIWSLPVINDLYARMVEHPDESADNFEQKLRRQLRGEHLTPPLDADPATYQLAGELLYVHLLPTDGIYPATKRKIITRPLSWSSTAVSIPADLDAVLDGGLANPGMQFTIGRFYQLAFLLTVLRAWKQLPGETQAHNLRDPWAFKQFLAGLPIFLAQAQRELLLHLLFPDTFEPMASYSHKQKIVAAFKDLVAPDMTDLDRQLAQIRAALTSEYGAGVHFYDPQIVSLWQTIKPVPDDESKLVPVAAQGTTGAAAGLSGAEQIRIALARIVELGGTATIKQIADAVQSRMGGKQLSAQGLASLRFFINRVAVQRGYLLPYDTSNPGWHITDKGRDLLTQPSVRPDRRLPRTLGTALRPYVELVIHLNADAYTADEIVTQLGRIVQPLV